MIISCLFYSGIVSGATGDFGKGNNVRVTEVNIIVYE